jgi:hypothetical protein
MRAAIFSWKNTGDFAILRRRIWSGKRIYDRMETERPVGG